MMKKLKFALFIAIAAIGCKKAFFPQAITSDKNKYLVIEGVINNGTDSTIIKLSRTQKIDTTHTISAETGAIVSVESDANTGYKLTETVPGTYVAGPTGLDAAHKYRLHIKTADNKEYVSDYIAVKNAPPIDSVGFFAQANGVQLYVNSHDATNNTRYYRWDYQETWRFHAAYRSGYYSNGVDSLKARRVVDQVYDCFAGDASSSVSLVSTTKLAQDIVYQAPLTVIAATSEKIETRYSVLVKQYALSSDAYAFWLNLQNNTEKLGSIFDVQPSDNATNYRCVNNPTELVVGYLSVGATTTKRIFISADQLLKSYSPVYPYPCQLDTAFETPPHKGTIPIGALIPTNSPYEPVSALYLPPANPFGNPTAFTYSTVLCVDCTVRGTRAAPSFWK
jgi:hypothetical protein